MATLNMIDFIDSSMSSYQEIGAKLYSYCENETNQGRGYKIVFFHSEHDQGKGNAVLKLFKQFAAFPVDIPLSEDCREVFQIDEIIRHPGTTVVVCALPIYPRLDDASPGEGNIKYFPQTWSAMKKLHASAHRASIEQQISAAMGALSTRTDAFTRQLQGRASELSGNVLFLSGLTVLLDSDQKAAFPETGLVPWNLTYLQRDGQLRHYDQPQLNTFLEAQRDALPQIQNLDRLLEEVE